MSVALRERLRRVLGSTVATPPGPPGPDGGVGPRRSHGPDVDELVPGLIEEGPNGGCFVAERAFGLEHVHGGERLAAFHGLVRRAHACLARDDGVSVPDPREVVFLDTETTGLSGGTGTYVFMVGLGHFEDDRFVVRQYFMRHHAEEPAMLAALNVRLARFRSVVSFNGKAFDLPLLQTRFVASRQRPSLRAEPHFDLLFPSRRLWRDRLESCSLGSIEQSILGHRRRRDVPSWMIPQLYFRYVRHGEGAAMVGVFEHNLNDVLSLVALATRLGRLLGDPFGCEADADDLYEVGRIYEELGYGDDAVGCYERALSLGQSSVMRARIAARLAQLCKRTGRAERALELWRRLATASGTCAPHVELAKHYEHRARDYAAAIAVVEQALTLLELAEVRGRRVAEERAELERRLARLLAKQRRARPLTP